MFVDNVVLSLRNPSPTPVPTLKHAISWLRPASRRVNFVQAVLVSFTNPSPSGKHVGLQIKEEVVCLCFEAARQLSITHFKLFVALGSSATLWPKHSPASLSCGPGAVDPVPSSYTLKLDFTYKGLYLSTMLFLSLWNTSPTPVPTPNPSPPSHTLKVGFTYKGICLSTMLFCHFETLPPTPVPTLKPKSPQLYRKGWLYI